MTPIDPAWASSAVHYAGFFDPGFGTGEAQGQGSKGVLEVRSHETPSCWRTARPWPGWSTSP
jgi:dCTP deaminase